MGAALVVQLLVMRSAWVGKLRVNAGKKWVPFQKPNEAGATTSLGCLIVRELQTDLKKKKGSRGKLAARAENNGFGAEMGLDLFAAPDWRLWCCFLWGAAKQRSFPG
jgi:hypothetical protein